MYVVSLHTESTDSVIAVQKLKFGVQWFLNRTNRLTKFRQNRMRSGFFCVDLTWNDPYFNSLSKSVEDCLKSPAFAAHLHSNQTDRS